MSRHTFQPRDKNGKDFGITISYDFEPAQAEIGQFGRREDARPPEPASVVINKVKVSDGEIMAWLDSVDINWGVLEERIINQHDES